jgi:hypothetical protein
MEGETPPVSSRKIVIALEDLQEAAPATSAPLPPVAGIAPAQPPAAHLQDARSGYGGPPRRPAPSPGDVLLVSFAVLWKVATAALIALAIGGYLWGAGNAAHERCFEHRITGDNSLVNTFACTVEH